MTQDGFAAVVLDSIREMREDLKDFRAQAEVELAEIKEQTTLTNGRVTALERARDEAEHARLEVERLRVVAETARAQRRAELRSLIAGPGEKAVAGIIGAVTSGSGLVLLHHLGVTLF